MLQMAHEYGITFVMVTHERELSLCGDRIVTIKDGRVLENKLLTDEEKAANRSQLFGDLASADVAEPETTVKEEKTKKGAKQAPPPPRKTTAEKAQAVQAAAAQAIQKQKSAQEGEGSK